MHGGRDGRGWPRPSLHLYLLVAMLAAFLVQIPLGIDLGGQTPLDSTAHVLLPAAGGSLLYDLLYRRVVHSATQYFATMWLLGVCAEMLWECVEFALDAVVRTGLQADNADTMHDIIGGICGATLGAGLRVWLWRRARRRDAERGTPARPHFYYRRSPGGGATPTYEGLWVAGSTGRWCRDRHSSIVEAERCARDRWWRDHERARRAAAGRPAGSVAGGSPLRPAAVRALLLRGVARAPGVQRGLGGVAVGAVLALVALVPSAYVGYLSLAPAAPAPPAVSIAAAAQPDPAPGVVESAITASVPIPAIGPSIPVGATPGFAVVSPNGRQAYVANRAAGVITVVDTAVNRVTATVPVVQGPPQYLAFSPDGRTVYVSIWNDARTVAAIGVLDTTTNAMVATVPVRTRPFLAAVTPDGRQLYVPNHDSGTVSVVDTAALRVTGEIRVSPDPHWVEISRDGKRAYTADHESNRVSVIDTATGSVVAEVPTGRSPHSLAVHPTRPLAAVADYGSDTVTVIDTDTDRAVATVPVGRGPQDVTWAPDGRFAYVACADADVVAVVDAATLSVTATLPVGDAPTSVAVQPSGQEAYVTNLHDGTLTVLDTAG
jgi:YVTN family beta-propeller protein